MPDRVQLSRAKGWRMPPNTVSVARPGPWGNPFRIGDEILGRSVPDAEAAVGHFRAMLADPELRAAVGGYPQDLSPLRGKHLACWCSGQPCHADVLLELANA